MPVTTAPLLSFGASGQIAKTQVYATWKGRPYVRRYVIPANPNSAAQQLTRSVFAFLNNVYKFGSAAFTDAWDAYASGKVLTGRNGFLKFNVSNLRTAADLTDLVFSPGALGGFAPASMALAAGATQITATLTPPSVPTGWTVAAAWAAAIPNEDPNTSVLYEMVTGTDASDPYAVVLTGLTTAQEYEVGGWFTFTRPDGRTAYGPSINDVETPT